MTTNSVSRLYQSSSWRSHSFSQLKSPHWTGDYSSVLMCLASIHQVMGSMLEHIHTHKHTHSMLMKAKDSILIVKKRIRKRLYYIKYHKKHCFLDLFKILKIHHHFPNKHCLLLQSFHYSRTRSFIHFFKIWMYILNYGFTS